MKYKIFVRGLFLFAVIFTACTTDKSVNKPESNPLSTTFAVISDAHYYDKSLGTSGAAFEAYLAHDRKLISESSAISQSAVQELISSDADFVIVAGDLTKDGAHASHEGFAALLAQIEAAGKKVFVVPGNHDVLNPHAMSYSGDTAVPIGNVSAEAFAEIYADYGYADALERDANSLSYVAEPVDGLWLICMDACLYSQNATAGKPVTGGAFNEQTLSWVLAKVADGIENGKTVFGMLHHGIAEHFVGQKTLFSDYVINDYTNVAAQLAQAGMSVVFTGHFHAQDIVKTVAGDDFLYDIETGSLVTPPCPFRMVSLQDDILSVTSSFIEEINYDTDGVAFQDYALAYLTAGLPNVISGMLMQGFGVSAPDAQMAAPLMTGAIISHYYGDEVMPEEVKPYVEAMMADSDVLKQMLGGGLMMIYTDPLPADNTIEIDLSTGNTTALF